MSSSSSSISIPCWKGPLKGIVTPLATPLLSQDVIDKPGTTKLLEHVLQEGGGVQGLFLLGSTGEGPSLSHEARTEFVQYCCQQVAMITAAAKQTKDAVQVQVQAPTILVSVSDTCFSNTVALTKVAKQAGANAVVLTTPYYFSMSQSELVRYVQRYIETCKADDIIMPAFLYNIPFLTTNHWEVETVQQLVQQYPDQIVGIKDSSGNLEYFTQLCRQLKKSTGAQNQFTVMMGPEQLLPQAIQDAGADGGVHGGSNIDPQLFVALYRALTMTAVKEEGNNEQQQQQPLVDSLMKRVHQLQQVYQVADTQAHPFSRFISGTKGALAVKGICRPFVNEPFTELNTEELERIRVIVEALEADQKTGK